MKTKSKKKINWQLTFATSPSTPSKPPIRSKTFDMTMSKQEGLSLIVNPLESEENLNNLKSCMAFYLFDSQYLCFFSLIGTK